MHSFEKCSSAVPHLQTGWRVSSQNTDTQSFTQVFHLMFCGLDNLLRTQREFIVLRSSFGPVTTQQRFCISEGDVETAGSSGPP